MLFRSEAMEEGQVTVDGISHPVMQPFLVIATQNPSGTSGTQPLPSSQLDRFALRLSIGYPDRAAEADIVRRRQSGNPLDTVEQALSPRELEALRAAADRVYLSDEVLDYLLRLVDATRSHPSILQGASPRATLTLAAVSRAMALTRGRDYVIPEDISDVFPDVIAHRLIYSAPLLERSAESALLIDLVRSVEAPQLR